MELLVISHPEFFPEEEKRITLLFEQGLSRLHLRKPEASAQELEELIRKVDPVWHPRMVLHDHHELTRRYALGGIHLNSRNPQPPEGFSRGSVSASCHTLDEVARKRQQCDYLFLSPVFDSISKEGYAAAFRPDDLLEAAAQRRIDRQVIALGGVTAQRIPFLADLGFGGAAVLGVIWQDVRPQAVSAAYARLREAISHTEGKS